MTTARIVPDHVRGFWPPLLLAWNDDWTLDRRSTEINLDRLIASQPHGLYTLDTASEFYTMELPEWESIARWFVQKCRASKAAFPIGLGCTWTSQAGALARIRLARELDVDVIHLSAPYWLPLNEDGLLTFFEAVQHQAGHLGVIVYAPPHGKITLTAPLYNRLIQAAPCIMGSKAMGNELDLPRQPMGGPRHSHFVHESHLVSATKVGALGVYSALAGISLPFCKHWWSLIEQARWPEAEEIQGRVNCFYNDGVVPIRERGILAGAIDKTMAQLGGAAGSRRLRPPYPSVPDDLRDVMLAAARRHLPEAMGS